MNAFMLNLAIIREWKATKTTRRDTTFATSEFSTPAFFTLAAKSISFSTTITWKIKLML